MSDLHKNINVRSMGWMRRLTTDRNFWILLVTTLGLIPLFVVTGGPFGHSDSTDQMLAFVYETKRMLSSGVPLWSWTTYFGQDFPISYAYYTLINPFSLFNCLFPYAWIPLGFAITIYIKLLICGWLSSVYFRQMGFSRDLALIGALLYTFSSWTVVALFYYMFLDVMMLFPLLLIFVERMIRGCRYRISALALAVFLTVWFNFVSAVGTLMVTALYFLFRAVGLGFKGKRLAKLLLEAVCSVVLGVLMASVLLVPVYFMLPTDARGMTRHESGLFVFCERLTSLLLPKIMEGRSPFILLSSFFNSNAAYVQIFGVMFPVLLFFKRRDWLGWLFLVYLLLYLTPLTGITSLFTSANYTRWAYALVMVTILATLTYLRDYGLPPRRQLLAYIAAAGGWFLLLGGASLAWHVFVDKTFSHDFRTLVAICVLGLMDMALLYWLCTQKNVQGWTAKAVVSVSIASAAQLACFCLYSSSNGVLNSKAGIDYSEIFNVRDADADADADGFSYRYDFNFAEGYYFSNYSMVHGLPSLHTFHSILPDSVFGLGELFYSKYNMVNVDIVRYPESVRALMSVGEIVDVPRHAGGVRMADNYIPMGFGYDFYAINDHADLARRAALGEDIALGMLNTLAIQPADTAILGRYLDQREFTTCLALDSLVAERRSSVRSHVLGDSRGLSATVETQDTSVVFFSIMHLPGLSASVDGEPAHIFDVNGGMSALVVPAGMHHVRFDYFPPYLKLGAWISLAAFILFLFLLMAESKKRL